MPIIKKKQTNKQKTTTTGEPYDGRPPSIEHHELSFVHAIM